MRQGYQNQTVSCFHTIKLVVLNRNTVENLPRGAPEILECIQV